MPINIPDDLPAGDALESENIFVMREGRAVTQDIRPMNVLILNLMPTKIETEIQILRLLSNSPLQTNIHLLQMKTHESKNTSQEYLDRFYYTFDEIKNKKFDGMIITGAPLENIDYTSVDYWDELCSIMDWGLDNVTSTLHICWGAQAGLYHHYNIKKYSLNGKLSGIFEHTRAQKDEQLLMGFDEIFKIPHSCHSEIKATDIRMNPRLHIVAESKEAGVGIVVSEKAGQIFVTGHPEYEVGTLAYEYERDLNKGLNPKLPRNYFPNDDPHNDPVMDWRGHATLLFSNWLNYYVYQRTPYDIEDIGRK